MKKWICTVCGYEIESETPPQECPLCGVGPEDFQEVTEQLLQFNIVIGLQGCRPCTSTTTIQSLCRAFGTIKINNKKGRK